MLRSRLLANSLLAAGLAGLWLIGWLRYGDETGVFGLFSLKVFVANLAITVLVLASTYVVLGPCSEVRRHRLFKVVLGFSSVSLCLGLLELPAVLGWIDYRFVLPIAINPDDRENPRLRLDRELIFAHLPNDSFVGKVAGNLAMDYRLTDAPLYPVDVRYDRNGFRNNRDIEWAEVVIVGDSFAEAALVPFRETASSRLADKLGVTVLNLGHIAYGPQQELLVLKRHGLPAQPKVVVWLMYEGNDLADFLHHQQVMANWDEYVSQAHSFARRSWSRNFLHALPKVAWPSRQDPRVGYDHSGRLKALGETTGARMYFRDSGQPLSAGEQRALAGARKVIQEACAACSQRQARFLLAFVPIKYRVYRDLVEAEPDTVIGRWASGPQPNDVPEQLESWCRSAGIAYLDLTPVLTTASERGVLTYFLDDTHWTPGGNAAAAEAIAEFIAAQAWLR